MTRERQLKIARKIITDGTQKELERIKPFLSGDAGMYDETSIKRMVDGMLNSISYVEFPDVAHGGYFGQSG